MRIVRRSVPVLVLLIIASACSSGGGSHSITGRVQYLNVENCIIDSANDVSVADANGKVLAAATMSAIQGTGGDCYEDFTISNVPSSPVYQFLMSGIVVKTISQSDLAAMSWHIVINPT